MLVDGKLSTLKICGEISWIMVKLCYGNRHLNRSKLLNSWSPNHEVGLLNIELR
jgi:hypothetical protein